MYNRRKQVTIMFFPQPTLLKANLLWPPWSPSLLGFFLRGCDWKCEHYALCKHMAKYTDVIYWMKCVGRRVPMQRLLRAWIGFRTGFRFGAVITLNHVNMNIYRRCTCFNMHGVQVVMYTCLVLMLRDVFSPCFEITSHLECLFLGGFLFSFLFWGGVIHESTVDCGKYISTCTSKWTCMPPKFRVFFAERFHCWNLTFYY